MRFTTWLSRGAMVVGGAALVRWQLQRLFTQQPTYVVERRIKSLEIRRYAPMVVAETGGEGRSMIAGVSKAFSLLAGYIFGGNQRRDRIAMTSPVIQREEGSGRWSTAFRMPTGSSLDNLPRPTDHAVFLHELPERVVAAIEYSGDVTEAGFQERVTALRQTLKNEGFPFAGKALSVRYDPPSTLGFLRRNEVWIELDDAVEPAYAAHAEA